MLPDFSCTFPAGLMWLVSGFVLGGAVVSLVIYAAASLMNDVPDKFTGDQGVDNDA